MLQRCLVNVLVAAILATVGAVHAGEGGDCPIKSAMKDLPKLSFAVGEEATHCAKTAEKLAQEHGKAIIYVVGKKKYDTEKDAKVHLVSVTEEFVENFAKPKHCKVSGTTTVAGKKLHCDVSAGKLAGLIKKAIDGVQISYLVGEEECHCPIKAKALAAKSGAEQIYVVGKEKTACKTTARLNLARARYRAAIKAMIEEEKRQAKVNTPAAAETSES